MMYNIKQALDEHSEYRDFLYVRGFCITDDSFDLNDYPFYGHWKEYELEGGYRIFAENRKNIYLFRFGDRVYFLIGHAYNPFTGETRELEILQKLSVSGDFWGGTDELTGIYCIGFCENGKIIFTNDAAGQQIVYYGKVKGKTYITSCVKLVGEHCSLEQDPYVDELIHYRFYHLFGTVLPGDLSPYPELKRQQCNCYTAIDNTKIEVKRFFPTEKVIVCSEPDSYRNTIEEIAGIIHENMCLIGQKWQRPAISVTGGMDSKTTMACSCGHYEKFSYFSYDSLPDEKVDADAAGELCRQLGLQHKLYTIPAEEKQYPDFELMREIFSYNSGAIGYNNRNDIRKRLFFCNINDFDIEVKSWVDEIGRAYYHKRFAKNSFPAKPKPRYLTTFYKAFLHNRKLVQKTDKIFEEYLQKYYSDAVFALIPWWDLVNWEFGWGAFNGIFMIEQVFSYDVTIPYNNRRLLSLMLSVPLEKRIADQIQKDVIAKMNPQIANSGINVKDVSHTAMRARMERLYWEINTRLPF